MRLFISGSAPLLADTHREWSARTGFAILERYGMTETNMNTSNPYDGDRVPGAVGLPLPGVSVRVTDPETGSEIARDTIGMIEVKGPNVFKGYWRMPEKTRAEFRDDGFFITGDLGKIAASAIVAFAATGIGWRATSAAAGIVGIVAAGAVLLLLARLAAGGSVAPEEARAARGGGNGWGIRDPRGFRALAAIGMIDNATRTGLLTFLPFALIAKGSTVAGVETALALVFAGGALGKFVCGLVAEKVGVIRTVVLTEAATTVGILAVLAAPLPVALAILLPLGIALNGTSSVLYATVADLVTTDRRSRAYGLYYTLAIGASSSAPTVYGLLSDAVGVTATLVTVALVVLATIPLCLALRAAVAEPARA
jgi:predicted MFS family arabinose efflux permease